MQNGPRQVTVGHVTAIAQPDHLPLAMALAEAAGQPVVWPGLGRRDPGPLRLIVVSASANFDSLSPGRLPPWGAGLAYPSLRTIVIRDGGDSFTTLRHELAHLALHDAVRVRVPLWFDEGYASWAAGEFGRLQQLHINVAVLRGQLPDFDELNRALRARAVTAETAYGLAATAVIELARRTPDRELKALFERLEAGEDFGAAVRATTGLTVGQYEVLWRRAVRQQYNLATWIAAGGMWTMLGAAVIVLHFYRRRRDLPRKRALDEGWDIPEAEEALSSDASPESSGALLPPGAGPPP